MSKDIIRQRLHQIVDEIEDESMLNILMEDAAFYTKSNKTKEDEALSKEQWEIIEQARLQIKEGNFKTYKEVNEHFATWLAK